MKQCNTCGDTKPFEAFPVRRDSPDGYRNQCRACRKLYMRQYESKWRAANPEKARNRYRRYLARHPEREQQRWNEYDAANREKRRLAMAQSRTTSPEHHRFLRKRWRDANPAKTRDIWYRWYEGTQHSSPDTVAYTDVLLHDGCSYCDGPAGHIDHIDPRSLGGAHDWTNLTAACKSCNPSKGKRKLLVWLAAR